MTRSRASCPCALRLCRRAAGQEHRALGADLPDRSRGLAQGTANRGRCAPGAAGPAIAMAAAVLLAALGAGGAWWYWGRSVAAPPAPEAAQPLEPLPASKASLAVLPFASPGGDARQERLADGIAEDLIGELGRYRNIAVIAKSSSFTYKGKAVDAREVGRELGVRYVLEGSLETDPERVRVAVQLIDAGTGAQVWSERYDRPLGRGVRGARRAGPADRGHAPGLWRAGHGRLDRARRAGSRRRTSTPTTTSGSPARLTGTIKEGLAEVRALLGKAIALDPSYPRAYLQLAWAHFNEALNGYSDDPARSLEQFHAAAEKMVALDPMDPHAQFIAGLSYFKRGERARGKEAWERALALAPNDPSILRDRRQQYALRDGDGAGGGRRGADQAGAAAQPAHAGLDAGRSGLRLLLRGPVPAGDRGAGGRAGRPAWRPRSSRRSPMPSSGARPMRPARSRRSSRKSPTSRPGAGSPTTSWSPAAARRRCSSTARARPACRSTSRGRRTEGSSLDSAHRHDLAHAGCCELRVAQQAGGIGKADSSASTA